MSPLHCNTVQEALWERAASSGPAALSPLLADHLGSCGACQRERRAVRELLEVTRMMHDTEPPDDIWDGFEAELQRRIARAESPLRRAWDQWGRRVSRVAAILVVGFGLGAMSSRFVDGDTGQVAELDRNQLIADLQYELGNDARLDAYVSEIENLMVAYRAVDTGEAVDVFRQSLPIGLFAGPGAPSEATRQRLERQRTTREQLRSVVVSMLASEVESERHGFAYLDRRIAAIAGQQLLYFIR